MFSVTSILVAPSLFCCDVLVVFLVPHSLCVRVEDWDVRIAYPFIVSQCDEMVSVLLWKTLQYLFYIVVREIALPTGVFWSHLDHDVLAVFT